jgi:hypothetical protein
MHVLAYCMTLVVTIINADEELYFKIALTLIFYSGLGTHCFVMEGKDPLSIQKVFAFEKIITSSYAKDPLSTNEQYSLTKIFGRRSTHSARICVPMYIPKLLCITNRFLPDNYIYRKF